MITFTSIADLDRLSDDDPAKPVVKQLLQWFIADDDFPDHPYDTQEHGYIALVEPGDVDRELADPSVFTEKVEKLLAGGGEVKENQPEVCRGRRLHPQGSRKQSEGVTFPRSSILKIRTIRTVRKLTNLT